MIVFYIYLTINTVIWYAVATALTLSFIVGSKLPQTSSTCLPLSAAAPKRPTRETEIGYHNIPSTSRIVMPGRHVDTYICRAPCSRYDCMTPSPFATKAFDRVQYCKLFRKLIDRNLPLVIIRFFIKYVYDASDTC